MQAVCCIFNHEILDRSLILLDLCDVRDRIILSIPCYTSDINRPIFTFSFLPLNEMFWKIKCIILIFSILQDKENGVSHNQQIPLKRGPKVNGVRRALVPQGGSKHKIGAMGENKDIIIPSQGEGLSGNVPTPEIIKSANIGSNTPASHQIQSANVKMEPVSQGLHERAVRENGQPKRSGMTFVVDSST